MTGFARFRALRPSCRLRHTGCVRAAVDRTSERGLRLGAPAGDRLHLRMSVCAVIAASALAAACDHAAPEAQASERELPTDQTPPTKPDRSYLKTETVGEEDVQPVTITGRVTFNEDRTQRVSTPIDGRVVTVDVQPSDRVRAGQTLFTLASPAVGQLQADALKAQHAYDVSSKALQRAEKLQAEGAVSDKEWSQLSAENKNAIAELARTQAQLKALNVSATDPTVRVEVRAQIAGTIAERNVLRGQEVRAGDTQPLVTISDIEHSVWVIGDVFEQDLALVREGAEVAVRVPAYPDEEFTGKVASISEVVDSTTHTMKIRCAVPNPGRKLKPEMFAKVVVKPLQGLRVATIPARAILEEGDQRKVIVCEGANQYALRTLALGPNCDGQVRVLAGVKPGETIVTDGALFLRRELRD
jgi:membrane fusion protein, heavy metal efflux system